MEDTDEHGSENTETQMNTDGGAEMDTDEQRLEGDEGSDSDSKEEMKSDDGNSVSSSTSLCGHER